MNLRELATLLNLSPTTVSRALNGYPEVSQKTKERVMAAAEAHGYVPNHMARQLATGRSRTIAHVIGLSDGDAINPIFADFVAGAGDTYAKSGYNMLVSFVPDRNHVEVYRHLAAQRSVDGVMLHSPADDDPRVDVLQELGLPFLIHGRAGAGSQNCSWLDIDNTECLLNATQHLLEFGHRRIAFLNGPEHLSFAARRREGFFSAHSAAGVSPDPSLIFHDHMTEAYGHDSAQVLLQAAEPPTAIVTSSVITAFGVRRATTSLGIELGRDVSLVTHDDCLSFLPNAGEPPLFTATQSSVRGAGAKAAEMLLQLIGEDGTLQETYPTAFVVGQSTAPPLDRARKKAV